MSLRIRRLHLIGVLVALAALIAPASALARSTTVVPFKTVGGIPLKITPKQVVARLGKPSNTTRVGGKVASYIFRSVNITVDFDTTQPGDPADFVGAETDPFGKKIIYRATDGVKQGDTEAQVKSILGSKCTIKEGGCVIWKGTPGAVGSYSFNLEFEQGKLTEIDNQYDFE